MIITFIITELLKFSTVTSCPPLFIETEIMGQYVRKIMLTACLAGHPVDARLG